jgi:DNA polymerase-3 subunit gamma/tau
MAYQVIARKWRPQTFAEVIGQEHVTRTLANAIVSGRVAHAYIFSGARGVGKTTTARILAKALNCVKGPAAEPCNECDSCREISAGSSLDVIEIDAASNRGIDQIRELREMVRYAPASSRYKVVILDEAHMLTPEASNALLKTLEEPPDRVVFILATTEPDELADTIRSRSQHFHFRALSFAEITAALAQIAAQEKWNVEPGALAVMARAAEGSVRDALSLLEQARAYSGETISDAQVRELLGVVPQETLDLLTAAIEQRSATLALELVHGLLAQGQNLPSFCREAIGHFRNLLVAKVCGAESDLVAAPAGERAGIARAAAAFSEEDLTRFFEILLETHDDLRRKPDERLHLEMGLLRMVNAARLAPLEQVLAELGGSGSAAAPRAGKASSATAAHGATSSAAPSAASSAAAPSASPQAAPVVSTRVAPP